MTGMDGHPYIANSAPEVRRRMLEYLGMSSLDELHAEIPDSIKLGREMNLPEAMASEFELRRHVESILAKNVTTRECICFLGGGCAEHYVPAVCDEINGRGEFLTAYGGEPYNDFGRFQALFEYQSLVAELTGTEVVNVPTMDWGQAAATSIRMASRLTKRGAALVTGTMSPERLAIVRNYCAPDISVVTLEYNGATGEIDLGDLKTKLSGDTACVYFENPSYLGFFETQGQQIADMAHESGAELIVGADPISLGIIAPPPDYGADIVCGDLQPLGIHMNYGGGQSGFIATRNEERYVMEYPSRLFGICPTSQPGEYAFSDVAYDRTSFGHHRHKAKEYVGTQTALWGITAGVYLSLMGPAGMREIGETILQKAAYARHALETVPGVRIRFSGFKEFVVDFNDTGKTVAEINKGLLKRGIFGGIDLSAVFPSLSQSALYCVTEVRTKQEIDFLATSLREELGARI
ncbi:MAG: aminomethyl-transferring glycine dehydrogenase subunit GcvPA [Oscillospiraceae bacterium]|jgi:glycine dehydrogenase subunit 1|nr:aminomethyl-transferring glycine dehydrogenase subunit GcvPA [Oscillospiraceae bacterium]